MFRVQGIQGPVDVPNEFVAFRLKIQDCTGMQGLGICWAFTLREQNTQKVQERLLPIGDDQRHHLENHRDFVNILKA